MTFFADASAVIYPYNFRIILGNDDSFWLSRVNIWNSSVYLKNITVKDPGFQPALGHS